MSKGRILALLGLALFSSTVSLQSTEPKLAATELAVVRENANVSRIVVPADDGYVNWRDVVRGVARAQQLDDQVLRPFLPAGRLNIHRPTTRYQLLALNLALPGVRMRVIKDDEQN